IGYRQLGQGPGLILIHGGMQASQNFMKLARALGDQFTVYVPDRRGRGLSGSFGDGYGLERECEDLQALLSETGTHYVFGLSSGALIAMHAALALSAIRKVALYQGLRIKMVTSSRMAKFFGTMEGPRDALIAFAEEHPWPTPDRPPSTTTSRICRI